MGKLTCYFTGVYIINCDISMCGDTVFLRDENPNNALQFISKNVKNALRVHRLK